MDENERIALQEEEDERLARELQEREQAGRDLEVRYNRQYSGTGVPINAQQVLLVQHL